MNLSDILNKEPSASSTAPRPKEQSRRSPEKDEDDYFEIVVREKSVRMRKADRWLDATQIMSAGGKGRNERIRILRLMKEHTTVEKQRRSSWVCFEHGQLLCEYLGLDKELRPLLNHGAEVMTSKEHHVPLTNYLSSYLEIPIGTNVVAVRKADFRVNYSTLSELLKRIRLRYTKSRCEIWFHTN